MRALLPLLLAATALGQQPNPLEVYPVPATFTQSPATSYADRSPLGTTGGELLAELRDSCFTGLGDDGQGCAIRQSTVVLQDWNAATPETFYLVLRRPAPGGGGPDPSPAGIIATSGVVSTPAGSGVQAFALTVTFVTPIVVPCEGGLFHGISVAAAPGYPNDGLAVHGAFYPPQGTLGDNPRVGAPNHAWAVRTTGVVAQRSNQSARMALWVDQAVLQAGGFDPTNTRQPPLSTNFGAGGLYPDVSGAPRSDGLAVHVFEANKPGGLLLLFASYQPCPAGGTLVPGITGRLWLHSNVAYLGFASLDAAGAGTLTVTAPGALSADLLGSFLQLQALLLDAPLLHLAFSNRTQVNF